MASHIGKLPIAIPAGVEVKIEGQNFSAKGAKGSDSYGNATLGGACYIHLTMGTNAVFSGFFSLFGHGNQLYELNHFRDESSDFLFRHFYMPLFKSDSLLPPF